MHRTTTLSLAIAATTVVAGPFAASAAAQQAYFSLQGDFTAVGDTVEFSIGVNAPSPTTADDFGFQTFANAGSGNNPGGTNRAGDVISAGGIDSVLGFGNPFVSGSLATNDDYDTTNHGFDSLLTWANNGTPTGGTSDPLVPSDVQLGLNVVTLDSFNNNDIAPWAIDLFGPAGVLDFTGTTLNGASTVGSLKFGTSGTGSTPAKFAPASDPGFAGTIEVATTGTAVMEINNTDFTANAPITVRSGGTLELVTPFAPSIDSILNAHDVTIDGGTLRRQTGAEFNLAPSRTLTVENNGSATFDGLYTLSNANATLLSGGTLTANQGLTLDNATLDARGGTLNIGNFAALTANNGSVVRLGGIFANVFNNRAFTVNAGSTLEVDGGLSIFGGDVVVDGVFAMLKTNLITPGATGEIGFGSAGSLTVRNGASADINASATNIGRDSTGTSELKVQAGSTMTIGAMRAGHIDGGSSSVQVTVSDWGSTLTQDINIFETNIGRAVGGSAEVAALNNGVINTGTRTWNVHPTGTVRVDGGTLNMNADLELQGGTFNRQSTTGFNLAAGQDVTATDGGRVLFTGGYDINGGSTFRVLSGSELSLSEDLDIGSISGQHGTLIVDGPGSSWTTGTDFAFGLTAVGLGSATGQVTLSNQAEAFINDWLSIPNGEFRVESDAVVNLGATSKLIVGNIGVSGTLVVDGAEFRGGDSSSPTEVGTTVPSATTEGLIASRNGGFVRLPSGLALVQPSGKLEVDANSTIEKSGPMTVDGGTVAISFQGLEGFLNAGAVDAEGDLTLTNGASLELTESPLDALPLYRPFALSFADAVVGTYATVDGVSVGTVDGFNASAAVTYQTGAVVLTIAISGDANLDETVGTGDLAVLAANFNGSDSTWATADFNGDGAVDTGDLAILAGNFGAETSLPATRAAIAAVPEPGIIGLAAIGLGGLGVRRRP
ncbi:MAG: dockerin type I domain-containing protein [Planctomycetota bacterium]